jgi:hypothetical protein
VRAIGDGRITLITQGSIEDDPYETYIVLEHGEKNSGLLSLYGHVVPIVPRYDYERPVKKGEIIATLHKDKGCVEGRLIHLHFWLEHAWGVPRREEVNPEEIFPEINELRAEPQGKTDFQIPTLEKQPEIYIANFRRLRLNEKALNSS